MIIEIPECKYRIRGEGRQWTVEAPYENSKTGETGWNGQYFYGQLEFAVMKLYELALRESDEIAEFADVPEKCRDVSNKLLKAVRKAVQNG